MELPDTSSGATYVFNTLLTDQEEALNYAVSYGVAKGWELMAVIWDSEDENKNHIFKIIYRPK